MNPVLQTLGIDRMCVEARIALAPPPFVVRLSAATPRWANDRLATTISRQRAA